MKTKDKQDKAFKDLLGKLCVETKQAPKVITDFVTANPLKYSDLLAFHKARKRFPTDEECKVIGIMGVYEVLGIMDFNDSIA